MLSHLSIKLRLSLVMAIGTLILTVFLLAIGQFLYHTKEQQLHESYLGGLHNLWRAIAETELSAMAANFTSLTRNRDLSKALFQNSEEAIYEAASPTATRLQAMHIVDNLIVITSGGEVAYSLLDDVKQAPGIARLALETGKPQQGFDMTGDGRLVNIVAFPLFDRADLVGVGVYEKGLQSMADKIKAANSRDIQVYDKLHKLAAYTVEDTSGLSDKYLQEQPRYVEISAQGVVTGIASVPLFSPDKQLIGHLVSREDVTEAVAVQNRLEWTGYLVAGVMLLVLTVGVALYLKSALRPLDIGVAHMERIASGDLSQDIACKRHDEFLRLLGAMQKMNGDLRKLVGTVVNSSDQLISTVDEVRKASDKTNTAVEEQKRDLDHLAGSLDDMAHTAAEVAEHINLLAATVNDSKRETLEGNKIIEASVNGIQQLAREMQTGSQVMQSLEEKSQRIEVVLDVIKGIAEQTNLLALNAAIEAARAGEQGRGFAVVADEVRTLAGRTQESTIEIEKIINALQTGVDQAVSTMAESAVHAESSSGMAMALGDLLGRMSQQMTEIDQLSVQVATAAEQQRNTTQTMNANVHNISKNADRTAEQCHHTSQTVNLLTHLSSELKQEMAHFKLQ